MSSGKFTWLHTSPERLDDVIRDINSGSQPQLSFFALLGTAAVIASLGLIANSTAVVIGAMLVSPLMTPIFGISLGMLRGDVKLVFRALTAEVVGVALAVGVSYLCGLTPLLVEAQPEMIARTEPTILDLLVAVFAGFAGAFALVDERISPALPGVAIATAIVPPLSTSGLYLALGHEGHALGAFLLFVANFASILLVGSLTFAAAGISPTFKWTTPSEVVRRFGFAGIGFLVIVIFLSQQIETVIQNRLAVRTINTVLQDEFEALRSTSVEKISKEHIEWVEDDTGYRGTVRVLATVRSPESVSPRNVTSVQEKLSTALDRKAVLLVRNILQKEVAAIGSKVLSAASSDVPGLFGPAIPKGEANARLAEQILLERLSDEPGFALQGVLWGETESFPFVLATVQTIRVMSPDEVRVVRTVLRERMKLPDLELLLRSYKSSLVASEEEFLLGWTQLSELMSADETVAADLERTVREEVQRIPDLFCVGVHFRMGETPWRILAEVTGARVPTPEQVTAVKSAVSGRASVAVDTTIWFRAEVVVTPDGYTSFEKFTSDILRERMEGLPELFSPR